MVEILPLALGLVLTALSGTLTALALLASLRFDDSRFAWVGISFFTIAVAGCLAVMSEFYNFAEEAFALEPGPLALLVVAVALLYLSMFRSPFSARGPGDGRAP